MEILLALAAFVVILGPVALLVWALLAAGNAKREARQLAERVTRLEQALAARGVSIAPAPMPSPIVVPQPAPAPAPPPPPPVVVAPRPAMSVSKLEELIGGIWLQNVGSVLLLVGVFFLILWGYSTGRLGPGALVAAGVVLGLGFLWRGDRVSRTTPAFGHALIGIGVGIVYLSLYVGHVRLGVLPRAVAIVSLVGVSIGSILLGLRYRVETIAALGVIGAYIPPLLGAWIPLAGFALAPDTLLAYLAGVGLSVYALSARAGWSRLDLGAVCLSALTWAVTVSSVSWAWHTEIGLALLFAALGLAPLPALVRRGGAPKASDLAVLALAPFFFTVVSVPFASSADRYGVAALSLSLAALYTGTAFWLDRERPERDLWRPVTAAAVLFLSLGLQRLVGDRGTALAWSLEGVLLVSFGLRSGSSWLRGLGSLVAGASCIALAVRLAFSWSTDGVLLPFVRGDAIRDLGAIASLLVGGHVLGRDRERLGRDERILAEVWTLFGNLGLATWLARECTIAAGHLGPNPNLLPSVSELAVALTAAAWTAQTAVLLWRGLDGRPFLRWLAYLGGLLVVLEGVSLIDLDVKYSPEFLPPFVHAVAVLWLLVLGGAMFLPSRLAARRDALPRSEFRVPEAWTLGIVVLWMLWTARESDHLARWIVNPPRLEAVKDVGRGAKAVSQLAYPLTSAAWLVEAVVLTVLGWFRASAYLRWVGFGLFALTILKILLIDLQNVELFWRFLTAILAGVALLAVSYAYQRKRRLEARRAEVPGA